MLLIKYCSSFYAFNSIIHTSINELFVSYNMKEKEKEKKKERKRKHLSFMELRAFKKSK